MTSPGRKSPFINVETLPCKMAVLCIDGIMGSIFPFLNLFYVTSGLTPAKAGLSNGIGSILSLIAGPLWGAIADSTKHRVVLITILGLGSTLTEFSKPWLVNFISKVETNVTCSLNNTDVNMHTTNCKSTHILLNPDEVFYTLLIVGLFFSLFFSGLMIFSEGTVLKVIFSRRIKSSYGQQKVFGPIGFALGNLVSGIAIDHYHPAGHLSKFTAAFYVFLVWCVLLMPCLYIMAFQTKECYGKKQEDGVNRTGIKGYMSILFSNFDNIMFILSVFVSGLAFTSYTGFIFLFLNDTMHPSKTMMSLTMVVAMASELIMYPLSSKIIKMCGGPIPCIIIGIFSFFPRLFLLSYCTNPLTVLPLQLFHGIGMSLSWSAMVEHNYNIFPKDVTTTALGVIASIHFVGASVFTNMIGGMLYHKYGGRLLFRGVASMAGIWSVLMILYFGIRRMCKKSKTDSSVTYNASGQVEI